MKRSDNFWQQLSTAVLWACISALLLLFPVMIYLLQPTADIEQREIRQQIQLQKELLGKLRTETALMTRGHRSEPREAILEHLSRIFAGVHTIEQQLSRLPQEVGQARRSWKRYTENLQPLQETVLDTSSASALYGFALSQLEDVFQQAELELKSSGLPADLVREYDLQLAKVMVRVLHHASLPSDNSALILENNLDELRQAALSIPSAEAQGAFSKFTAYADGLMQATDRIRANANTLMSLAAYEHLNNFDERFQSWISDAQAQQRQSRWTLIIAVLLLVGVVVVALLRLKVTQDRLLKSSSKLSAYKTAMDEHAIVSITDPNGRIEYINRKFLDISGYTEKELIGRTHKVINSGVHPRGFFKQLWQHVAEGKTWHDDVCNRRKDGSLYWVSATVVPMFDSNNELESIISVRTDITAIKQTERALTAEKERAEVANKAKSDFLANMSHEIRTPMNAVIGMSHLARQVSQDEQVTGYIDKIQHSAQNLLSIINDILDFSKIEAGRLEVEQIPFRLDNVISHMADMATVRADEKQLPLIINVDDNVPRSLEGDPLRLGQVLLNLVNNAIKFTEKGSVTVGVQLLAHKENQVELRFSVTDTGIGLSREQIARLFQSFSQADTSTTRQYGGTGLGLAISKQLIELMQGEIGVHSTPGAGSEFFFTLSFHEHETAGDNPIDMTSVRVLAVDDDNACLQSVREQLMALGVPVEVESDSPAGLNRLVNATAMGEDPFNVLLIDWQMPIMDGFEVAKAVRNNSALPWQPAIIMLTAHGGEDLQRRINHNLVDGVLLKPVTGSHLQDTIQDILSKKSSQRNGPTIRTLFREGDEINALLGARVLIAEDNSINQEVITGLLEPFGLETHLVSNGREAVERLQTEEFDLILMDLQMPEVDGLQATEQILQMNLPKTPPIVAMTAHAQQEEIRHCLDVGMSDHLSKPINPENLKEKLIRWIEPRVISGYSLAPADNEVITLLPDSFYGVDLSHALQATGNKQTLLLKLLKQFAVDYAHGLSPVKELMAQGDWPVLTRWLHTLKGASATLGMLSLADQVSVLEKMSFNQTLPGDHELSAVEQELTKIVEGIRDSLADSTDTANHNARFVASMQPGKCAADSAGRLSALLPELKQKLAEGDSEVLDALPELLELVQTRVDQLEIAIQVMEYAEQYEFDQALEQLEQLRLTD